MKELAVSAAVDELRRSLMPVAQSESIDIRAAQGRVLAAPVLARVDLPAFDNSAMDGYAYRAADFTGAPLTECGRSLAGHGYATPVPRGACVRIMTGAPVPTDTDTVVVLEDVKVDGNQVQVLRAPAAGANIRRRAEHVRRGEVVLQAGTWLGPNEMGYAAGTGVARVDVRRKLHLGVASTGDELADPPQALSAAGGYDANRPLLLAAASRLGFDVEDLGICPDDGAAFNAMVERAFALELDALVLTGGASQGDADIVRQAGGIRFLPLDIRPGRGLAYAVLTRGTQRLTLLGLPGNAVAAFVMFHLVARPALLHLAGATPRPLPRLSLPLAHATHTRGGRIDYRRGRIVTLGDAPAVELLADQGSAMLRTVVEADVLVAIGPQADTPQGAPVSVIPIGLL